MNTLAQIVALNVSNNYLDLINIEIGNRKSDNTDTCDRLVELSPYYQGINAKNDCNVDWKYVGGIITYGCKSGEALGNVLVVYPYLALKSGVEASVNKIMTGDFNYDDQYASNQLKYENKYNRDLSNPIQDIATTVIFAATTIITAGMSSAFIAPASSSLSSFLTGASSGLIFGAVRIGTMAVIDSLIFSSVNFAVTNAVAYTFGTDTVSLAASFCGTDNATATSCLTNQGKQIAFSIFLHSVGSAAKSGATHIPSKVEINKFVRSSMGRIIKPAYALGKNKNTIKTSISGNAILDSRKFTEYIFKPGADNGKSAVFEKLGYNIDNTDNLIEQYLEQASDKFKKGDYTLGVKDNFGQRINIEIKLNSITDPAKISYLKSGWIIENNTIKLTTPFSGFTK